MKAFAARSKGFSRDGTRRKTDMSCAGFAFSAAFNRDEATHGALVWRRQLSSGHCRIDWIEKNHKK